MRFSSLTRVDEELRTKAAEVDAEQAKAGKKTYDSEDVSHRPGICARIVGSPLFDIIFACLILTNAVFIGVEVQYGLDNGEDHWVFQAGRNIYTVLFSFELFVRLGAQRKDFFCGEDRRWNCLDSVIVFASWWEVAVEIQLLLSPDGTDSTFAGITGIRTLRIIRITRLVKVARLARVLRFVMALRTLTQSILYTLKSLIWAMVLLLLIVYSFGILFTQVVNDAFESEEVNLSEFEREMGLRYFGNLWRAMTALYMSIAGGVSWEQVLDPLQAISWVWVLMYIFYIAFSSLAVLNVVTGVFCQSAIESAQSDHDMVIQSILNNKEAHIEKIKMLFTEIDAAESGVITFQMFQERIMSQEVKTYFESIDLDVWDAWTFFKLLDMDAGGAVEIEEFLLGCLRLRGNAKAMDIAKLCHDQTWLIREQARRLADP
ncbi:scn4ab [Symbiodinium natans]|uniref:Scn4ab protein n=1 Tax=Symbiodinium natans TaxID=878477 RepID=A0A812LV38_9DINO|nr:scn4ab [Symbiodinium natans]